MPLNNPGGSNQMGSFQIQPQYGDVKRETALTREAPMSGAAVATDAVQAPRRAGLHAKNGGATRSGAPQQGAAGPPNGAVPPPSVPPTPEAQAASVWQQIAQTPGASPLVQQYAAQAASGS